jgi:CysZ protein
MLPLFWHIKTKDLLKELVISIEAYFKAHRFIMKHKLWKWIIIPGLIYMALFVVSMYFFSQSSSTVVGYMVDFIKSKLESSWLSFMATILGVIFFILLMLFYFSLFKYIWLILGSPVFAYLSEKTESILEGRDYPFSMNQLMKDIARGVRIALRNMLWQTVYTVAIMLLSFIPVLGWATPVIAILVECYYYGFSMLDYSCERHKLSAAESIDFIGRHKGLAIGNGMVFYLFHPLLIVGWIFAPAYAVVAATLSLYHQNEKV